MHGLNLEEFPLKCQPIASCAGVSTITPRSNLVCVIISAGNTPVFLALAGEPDGGIGADDDPGHSAGKNRKSLAWPGFFTATVAVKDQFTVASLPGEPFG